MEAEEHLAEMTLPPLRTTSYTKRTGSRVTCSHVPTDCHLNQEGYKDKQRC